MSEVEKDLDFSDIAGKTTKKMIPKSKKAEQDLGIFLGVIDKDGVYTTKDLSRVTAAEFITWARGVFPVDLRQYKTKLTSKATRYRYFNTILKYHTECAYLMGKEAPKDVQH